MQLSEVITNLQQQLDDLLGLGAAMQNLFKSKLISLKYSLRMSLKSYQLGVESSSQNNQQSTLQFDSRSNSYNLNQNVNNQLRKERSQHGIVDQNTHVQLQKNDDNLQIISSNMLHAQLSTSQHLDAETENLQDVEYTVQVGNSFDILANYNEDTQEIQISKQQSQQDNSATDQTDKVTYLVKRFEQKSNNMDFSKNINNKIQKFSQNIDVLLESESLTVAQKNNAKIIWDKLHSENFIYLQDLVDKYYKAIPYIEYFFDFSQELGIFPNLQNFLQYYYLKQGLIFRLLPFCYSIQNFQNSYEFRDQVYFLLVFALQEKFYKL